MNRRIFVAGGIGALGAVALHSWPPNRQNSESRVGPVSAVIPVVGDGKWIWTEPPKDQTGYLEPRPFELSIGFELSGEGEASHIEAATPVPMEQAEQEIGDVRLETEGCDAEFQQVAEGALLLYLSAPQLSPGQRIKALARYRMTLKKQYLGYKAEQFPAHQPPPPTTVRKQYLQESPGIQAAAPEVRKLLAQLHGQDDLHPWSLAERAKAWISENIRPQAGKFIGVVNALKERRGDCEEMAGIMVALCRAAGVPARLVWVPNHNWSEIYLTDHDGVGHWIPVHTACYAWMGWTGVHELVIQKGDRVTPPHERKAQRLLGDWLRWVGKRPAVRYIAELKPLPPRPDSTASPGDNDPGPGARSKQSSGEWKLVGNHPFDSYMRNG